MSSIHSVQAEVMEHATKMQQVQNSEREPLCHKAVTVRVFFMCVIPFIINVVLIIDTKG